MKCLDTCLVGFVHKVNELETVVAHRHAHEGHVAGHQLHLSGQTNVTHLDPLDHLMELEVADE